MLAPDRPRIKLRLTPLDKITEITGWCIVIAMWCVAVSNYALLPDTIPVHYNSSGQIDGYGDKSMIWGLLIAGSVMYAGLFFLSRIPHIFNYPVKITEENAPRQYTTATRMLRYLNLTIVLVIGFLVVHTVHAASGSEAGPGLWILPLLLALIFGVVIYFIVQLIVKK